MSVWYALAPGLLFCIKYFSEVLFKTCFLLTSVFVPFSCICLSVLLIYYLIICFWVLTWLVVYCYADQYFLIGKSSRWFVIRVILPHSYTHTFITSFCSLEVSFFFVFHQKQEEHKKIKKNGNKLKITSRFHIFDKWSHIWWPLAMWDPLTSYQSLYVSVLANILDFFNCGFELCNHSASSPLMTLQVGQWSPWQPPVAWEERWLERKEAM